MKRILLLPWMLILRDEQAIDARQGAYARQVPRYLSLRLDETPDLSAQFAPYCTESEEGTLFVVSGRKQAAADLREIGRQYEVDVVVGGQAEFGETAEIHLQVVDVQGTGEIERSYVGALYDCRAFFESLLHLLLLELHPEALVAGLPTCEELSSSWPAVSAFFCAIDKLMASEINGGTAQPQAVFELFHEALAHDPMWEDGAEQLIGAAIDAGLGGQAPLPAIETLERLLEKRGDLHKAWEALGYLYSQLGQVHKAAVCLESAQRIDPQAFASHHRLGSVYREIGRYAEAEAMLRVGLQKDPENIPLLNEIGVLLGSNGRAEEAVLYFQKAVALSPISGAFHANLAVSLQRVGRLIEAEEAFVRGMQAVDAHWNVYVNYARFLKEQGRHLDWVRVLFQGIQALADQGTEQVDLATRMVEGVREWIGEAVPPEIAAKGDSWISGMLESLVELLPEHRSAWVVLAEFYRREGRQERALDCLTRVEGSDPGNVWLKVHIGSILAGLGRHEEAIHRFESVLQLEEDNQMALANLIMIFAMQDRYDQALGLLDRYRQIAYAEPQFAEWEEIVGQITKGDTK